MKKGFRVWMAVSASLMLLLFSLPFIPVGESAELGLSTFFGRLHPMLVHFPIVLLMLPLVLEAYAFWKKSDHFRMALDLLLPLAILSSLVAVFAGFLLYQSGEYTGNLVSNHLWGGVMVSIFALAAGLLYMRFRLQQRKIYLQLYLACMILSNVALIYTGHLGGSLTHGTDFLTAALPDWGGEVELKNPDEIRLFEEVVMGIFQSKCLNCHNPHKAKGGLVMSSYEQLLAGGKSDKPMLVPHHPDSSELFLRIALPSEHDDHMPPSGKPDLTPVEIDLIQAWVAQGAALEQRLAESTAELQQQVKAYMPQLLRFQRKRLQQQAERDALLAELKPLCRELHLHIEPDPDADSLLFALSMQLPPAYVDDQSIRKLMPYAEYFSKISLPASQITDEGLYFLSQFPNLQRLYLQKTCVKGEGLAYLKTLPALEALSLSYTEVDDVSVFELMEFPALKRVYLFQTHVGVNMAKALDQRLKKTRVLNEEGPYY